MDVILLLTLLPQSGRSAEDTTMERKPSGQANEGSFPCISLSLLSPRGCFPLNSTP